jgi:hypothetical protein
MSVPLKRGEGPRHPLALATICDVAGVFVIVVVLTAQTPGSACGGTGCDNEYGVDFLLGLGLAYLPSVLGVVGGRWLRDRREK